MVSTTVYYFTARFRPQCTTRSESVIILHFRPVIVDRRLQLLILDNVFLFITSAMADVEKIAIADFEKIAR